MKYIVYLHSGPNTALEEVVIVEAETVDIKDKLTSLYTAYPKKLVLAFPSYRLRLIVEEGAATVRDACGPPTAFPDESVYCGCPDDCTCKECPSCVAHASPEDTSSSDEYLPLPKELFDERPADSPDDDPLSLPLVDPEEAVLG